MGDEDREVRAFGEFEIHRAGGTGFGAFPAAGAVGEIDHVLVGDVVWHGEIDGCPFTESGVEGVRDANRADSAALPAADAFVGVHKRGLLLDHGLEFTGFPLQTGQPAGEQDVQVAVEESLAQAELGRIVPLGQREHFAHPAMIAGKLIVQLGQQPAEVGFVVDQEDLVFGFGQIQGGANAADAGSNHEGCVFLCGHDPAPCRGLDSRLPGFRPGGRRLPRIPLR